jgi:hypothetical protein
LVEARVQFETLADDGHQHVNRDSDPDLGLDGVFTGADGVFTGAEKGLDAQVLLDPVWSKYSNALSCQEFL